ncbi:MAG: hypothetical protein ACK4LQ_02160 [Pararhodobacter sp.]
MTKKPTARAARPKPQPDYEGMRAAVQRIEDHVDHNPAALIEALKIRHKLKLTFSGGTHIAQMLGIRASATAGNRQALKNWANAARRALKGVN